MILPQLLWRFLRHRDDPEFYRLQASDAVDWLELGGVMPRPDGTALDLGCGHGVFGAELQRRGWEVTYADYADQRLAELSHSPFFSFDLDRDSYDGRGQFDLVICSNVLEHLKDPQRFITNSAKLLTPGGRLYLSWTNWLSPWGGHEFSPLHYLGPTVGPAIYDRVSSRTRFHQPGENLFITYVGEVWHQLEEHPDLTIMRAAPRYYTELPWLMRIPGVREVLAWNAAFLIRRR